MSELAKAKEFGRVSGLDKLSQIESRLIRRRMALLGGPPVAIVMGDGRTVSPGSGKPVGAVIIRDRKTLLKFFVRPERHFGD
ncbi:MAG TPA: hypothetical protein VF903_06370, partial [Nitrospirota bacterium]